MVEKMEKYEKVEVINLEEQEYVGEQVEEKEKYYRKNVGGKKQIIEE